MTTPPPPDQSDPTAGGPQPDPTPPSYGQQTPPPAPDYGQAPPSAPDHGQAPPPGYGQTPPPAYGQTPPPGYGQTPPPAYGQTPPPGGFDGPPPAPGYGAPQGGYPPAPGYGTDPTKVDVGQAFNWAWSKFKNNVGAMVLPGLAALALIIILTVVAVVGAGLSSTEKTIEGPYGSYTETEFSFGGTVLLFLLYLVFIVALFYLQASIISGAVRVANGEPVTASSFLVPTRFGPVLITAIIVGVITSIGMALFVIPGLIAIFFLQFAVVATIDRGLSPIDAIKASFDVAKCKVGDSLVTLILTWLLTAVGAIVCYVGLIVSVPFAQLFFVHCWRRLNGAPIAPPDPA
ncbi:hypothetical protein QSJ18_05335 [Gordonia sp. ABSL1-1]|uniref:hypothetical protein n=1 Tax=Gordonia sp. ABSL1-1 TaxID=3053923 RepID=UPI002573D3A2|nr:hypothetical protein [Gordonia sp. ABSL1-1]MDL9936157.1 hypothetical protein [Gordonia sp. ABSL1-1]